MNQLGINTKYLTIIETTIKGMSKQLMGEMLDGRLAVNQRRALLFLVQSDLQLFFKRTFLFCFFS